MAHGIKLGVVALENSGKTTLISNIKDALVVSTDNKAFTGKIPHFRYSEYFGLEDLLGTIGSKIELNQEKYGKLPRTLVVDSVTHLANNMEKYWNEKATGFAIWAGLGKDILAFNAFLEDTVIPSGINVVFTSHCQFDKDTAKYQISAPGNFGKNGSWLNTNSPLAA
jgi:GTPase SAR1 family protein